MKLIHVAISVFTSIFLLSVSTAAMAASFTVYIHNSDAEAVNSQCTGGGNAQLGEWTPYTRVSTTTEWGGCNLRFGIVDPQHELSSYGDHYAAPAMFLIFNGANRCIGSKNVNLPIPTSQDNTALSETVLIDTDSDNPGPCTIEFQNYSNVVVLDIDLHPIPNGDGPPMCSITSDHNSNTVSPNNWVTLSIRYAPGCEFRFRLRKVSTVPQGEDSRLSLLRKARPRTCTTDGRAECQKEAKACLDFGDDHFPNDPDGRHDCVYGDDGCQGRFDSCLIDNGCEPTSISRHHHS